MEEQPDVTKLRERVEDLEQAFFELCDKVDKIQKFINELAVSQ